MYYTREHRHVRDSTGYTRVYTQFQYTTLFSFKLYDGKKTFYAIPLYKLPLVVYLKIKEKQNLYINMKRCIMYHVSSTLHRPFYTLHHM